MIAYSPRLFVRRRALAGAARANLPRADWTHGGWRHGLLLTRRSDIDVDTALQPHLQ